MKSVGWNLFPHYLANQHLAEDHGAEVEEAIVPLFLEKNAECVDVGANRGRYTILMSLFSGHVHAFDPNPQCIHRLQNLGLPNVSIYPYALSSAEGVSEYFVPIREGAQFSVWGTLERSALETHHEVDTLSVPRATLDVLCRQGDRPISFIKIDVEGHEMEVLQGGRRLIAEQKPVVMVEAEERHRQDAVRQVHDFFRAFDYRGFFIREQQVFPLESFEASFQEPEELKRPVPRVQMHYVNNFIFIPSSSHLASVLEQMTSRLGDARLRGH